MSIQSAREFLAKLTKDEEFRKGLTGCNSGAERREYALGAGFECTGEEIKAAVDELQDADLEVISGGVTDSQCFTQTGDVGY